MFDPRDWLFGKSTYKRGGGVTAPKARRRPPTRLAVEVLEDRVNPSSFNWTGAGGDNLWENPANWDQIDHLPTIDDSASIATANAPIVNQQGNIAVGFLMDSTAYDLIIHGNLTVGQGAMISGRLVVDGSVTAASGIGNTISADSLDLAGQIHLAAGSQLSLFGTTSMLHTGAAIDGDGTLNNFGTLAIDGDATVNNLTDAGNLAAPGVLTITGTMNWQAGALAKDAYGNPGTLDIAPAAALNIAGSTTLTIDAWTINDYGTINWTGGDVNNADSTVNIACGATFTITADNATWRDSLNDGGSTINNAGTLTKAAGTMGMPVTIEAQLNSSGHIGAEIGEISLKGGGSFAGLIDIRGTASVVLANGVFLAEGFAQVNGQGQGPLIVDGSTSATLNFIIGVAPVLGLPSVTLQNVELRTDGLISGPGTLEISRQLIWSGGVMNGTGTTEIAAGALMAMKGNVAAARPIVNRGITGLLDGKILSLTDCTFSNFGELTAQGGTMIAAATAATRLRNEAGGHITKALQGTANFVVPVVNDGSIDVTQGELRFTVPSQHGQDINIQVHSDATLRFRRLAHTFGQGASIFGAGQLIVDMDGMAGTTLNFGANTSVAVADFQMNGAANRILGSAIFACGEYHLNGGAIAGTTSVQVSPEKEMEVSGGLSLIDNASIRNYGTIHWVADNITTASNAAITNDGTQGEGIFSIETASQLLDVTPDGQPTAVTLKAILGGTISVAPATGNVTVQALLVNDQGELNLNGNHLTLRQRDGSVPWDYSPTNGITDLGGGRLDIIGAFYQSLGESKLNGGYLQATAVVLSGGRLELGGGTIDVTALVGDVIIDGTIQGSGTIFGNVTNRGTVSISDGIVNGPAILEVFGSYSQTSTGALRVTLAGTNAGADYDQLRVHGGDVILDGFLDIALDSFDPTGNSFDVTIFDAGARQGTFSQLRPVGNNFNWSANYNSNDRVTIQP